MPQMANLQRRRSRPISTGFADSPVTFVSARGNHPRFHLSANHAPGLVKMGAVGETAFCGSLVEIVKVQPDFSGVEPPESNFANAGGVDHAGSPGERVDPGTGGGVLSFTGRTVDVSVGRGSSGQERVHQRRFSNAAMAHKNAELAGDDGT